MRIVVFCHSIVSDWNHGNAHFLRGVVRELRRLGHAVEVFEPRDSWSRQNLVREQGAAALAAFAAEFPDLSPRFYDLAELDAEAAIADADLVLVHEWTAPALVEELGRVRRRRRGFVLLFHDTHHRAVTEPRAVERLDLSGYDGLLAFGAVLRELYLARGRVRDAWTWHEAADHRLFRPMPELERDSDLVWIGNWGDGERSLELREFLIEPVRELGLKARIHGVRYSDEAKREIADAGIPLCGWVPNARVPRVFARHRVTVHVPRRPYAKALPGIPTIRVFEALACGIPLVTAPWSDCEGLFEPGDMLFVEHGVEMASTLRELLAEPERARQMAERGRRTILARHTCAHRARELIGICEEIGVSGAGATVSGAGRELGS